MFRKNISFVLTILFLLNCNGNTKHNSVEYTVLANVTIIDGTGNPPLENKFIVLKDSLIFEIGDMGAASYGDQVTKLDL
jgi:hypothetical protein